MNYGDGNSTDRKTGKGNSMFYLHSPFVILESPEVRPMWLQGRDLRKLERIMAEGASENQGPLAIEISLCTDDC